MDAKRSLKHSQNCATKLIFLTTYFSFDEVSPESDVKLDVIIFNMRIILVEDNGARSLLDLSNSPFIWWNLADLDKNDFNVNPNQF